ncbi:MAG TPA: hypothetical protein H9814_02935 [Candidatus Bacteroides merdigallinarum]|uniref:DUF3298 domain-containing protein n=1 Tax=Candidatus Bacteroides merdigallinarum TaxID=2838473 RepID=A0A9D2E7Z2_9BACE|nr:hypothetical protein [Candidatus Bacteroides merdigallinarum]
MGKIEKAQIEAMKALQQAKERAEIPEDVIENIKKTHQEFMKTPSGGSQDTLPPQSPASQGYPKRENIPNTSAPKSPKPYKRELIWVIGSMAAIILLSGIGYTVHSNQHVAVIFDTIDMRNDFLVGKEKISRRDFYLTYPTKVKEYDLTPFYKKLFKDYFLESQILEDKSILTTEAENLDFREAARKIIQSDEDYWDDYHMFIRCSYDEERGWLSVNAEEITCPSPRCYFISTFFYSLEKQKVLIFDDIFLPEKEEQLMKLIQERILSKPSMPEKLTQEKWKPVISQFDLVKEDSVWCWQIDCLTEPDLELPRAYYPIRTTIAEKSLAEYLSYPVPQE